MTQIDRYRGCLLGLAVGDAVGTTLEFKPPGSFQPIDDMTGGGPFRLQPGQWTDDTSMALCLSESLIKCRGFNARDKSQRYVRWWKEGHLSSTGRCFDIGSTVRSALDRFLNTDEPLCGSQDPNSAGNGSIMRLAPVVLFFGHDPMLAIRNAAESSRTTHGAATCVDACRYLAALITGALCGINKAELLGDHYSPEPGCWEREPLHTRIDQIASGSFKTKRPPAIRGTGFVVDSLEAALWAFHTTDNFSDGCLAAANLGDNADTTAAVYGQLAGAFYGEDGIPETWLARLHQRELIASFADRLHELSAINSRGSNG